MNQRETTAIGLLMPLVVSGLISNAKSSSSPWAKTQASEQSPHGEFTPSSISPSQSWSIPSQTSGWVGDMSGSMSLQSPAGAVKKGRHQVRRGTLAVRRKNHGRRRRHPDSDPSTLARLDRQRLRCNHCRRHRIPLSRPGRSLGRGVHSQRDLRTRRCRRRRHCNWECRHHRSLERPHR